MSVNYPLNVLGDSTHIEFPTTIESLLDRGAAFLTLSFRRSGVIDPDNSVVRIQRSREFFGGGMGRKLCLSVEYARQQPGLSSELFVKFPREFADPLRSLFGPLMESEVRLAQLSRHADFPVDVPMCYFADFHKESTSGILITERILYGEQGIEHCHDKCVDYELPEPLQHYQALTRTMAKLAGYHKSGRCGPEIQRYFPFDPSVIDVNSRIPYTQQQLEHKLSILERFASRHPRLIPSQLASAGFLRQLREDAMTVLTQEVDIRRYINSQSDCVALCHWNVNVDNAWFWRNETGTLEAGLLDWGGVGQMNVAQGFYGMTCAAESDFLEVHRDALISQFLEEYQQYGGPAILRRRFDFMLALSVAFLGIAWILDAPSIIEANLADIESITDRHDPLLKNNFLVRAQLHLLIVMLSEWQSLHVGKVLTAFVGGDRP